jgi:Domain of unknown function (DUF3395)
MPVATVAPLTARCMLTATAIAMILSCVHYCTTAAAAEEEAQVFEVIQLRAAAARTAAAQQAKLMVHMAARKRAAEAANADSGLIILRARYGLDLHIDYGERLVSVCTF